MDKGLRFMYKIQTHGFTRQVIELQASHANMPLPQGVIELQRLLLASIPLTPKEI